jgi:sugar phosphate isomerase/epimerase
VDGKDDLHTLPFMSKINWDSVTAVFKEIGYEGDFTYECGAFFNRIPNELMLSAARFSVDVGRCLMGKIQG